MKKKYAKPQEPESNEHFPRTNDDKSRNIFFYWGVLKSINSQMQHIQFSDQMNSIQQQKDSSLLEKIDQETNEHKTFSQSIFKINYSNTSQVIYQSSLEFVDNVQVKNYLCYQDGQKLCKVTEISYQDKMIRITDTFSIGMDPLQIQSQKSLNIKQEQNYPYKQKSSNRKTEKVRIFKKQINRHGKAEKKDKKNIVKNIVKMFLSWLSNKSGEKSKEVLMRLKEILNEENFNNRLIKKIVGEEAMDKYFLEFLTEYAEMEIQSSRIQDKESHYEAIELYVDLIKNGGNRQRQLMPSGSQPSEQYNYPSSIQPLSSNQKLFLLKDPNSKLQGNFNQISKS